MSFEDKDSNSLVMIHEDWSWRNKVILGVGLNTLRKENVHTLWLYNESGLKEPL